MWVDGERKQVRFVLPPDFSEQETFATLCLSNNQKQINGDDVKTDIFEVT